ncbi:hypothetical protein [Actinoplanes sp. NPDC049118]|uniref:hypothetical protein n=1 Tax=Actinoplanes sp. NPDC049118 TaxID=3155769 RepID=UPI0033FB64F9
MIAGTAGSPYVSRRSNPAVALRAGPDTVVRGDRCTVTALSEGTGFCGGEPRSYWFWIPR